MAEGKAMMGDLALALDAVSFLKRPIFVVKLGLYAPKEANYYIITSAFQSVTLVRPRYR